MQPPVPTLPIQPPLPPTTGPGAIAHVLSKINLEGLRQKHLDIIKSGAKSKRAKSVHALNAIEGLSRNNLTPDKLMISSVPVIPPSFRPFSVLGSTFVSGAANELYRDLFQYRDMYKETADLLGDKGASQARLDLFDTARALYGYGEPIAPKTKQRGVAGFLKQITGAHAKESFVQRKLLSKTQDSVSRGTISVNPDLSLDEIGVPLSMAWVMYAPYIQRRLVQNGMSPSDALRNVKDRSDFARRALDQEVGKRPVIYSRAPSWHKFNVLAGKPKLIDGDTIAINALVGTGLNADHNGDAQIGKVLVALAKKEFHQIQHSVLLSHVSHDIVAAMIAKSIIPAFNTTTHQLHLVDLAEFPRTELQNTNPNGRNGPIEFYAVPPDTMVVAFDETTGTPVWTPVSCYSIHPQRAIELVDLSNGRQITTDDDPRAIYGVDPSAGNFQLGRFTPDEALAKGVLVPCMKDVESACSNLASISSISIEGEDGISVLQQDLNWDFGYLLGALAGDGWWDKKCYGSSLVKQIHLSDLKEFNAFRVCTILRDMFGQVGWSRTEFNKAEHPERYGDTIRHSYYFSKGAAFAEFLTRWLKGSASANSTGSGTKCLPDFFLLAPREFREGLLNGLIDTDGSVSVSNAKGKPQLICNFSSTSLRLATDVKFLCLTLGIQVSVCFSKVTTKGNTSWLCSLSAPDCKRLNIFANLACPWKRDAFINTYVTQDNTSQVFDKVLVPKHIQEKISCELESPKIRTHERTMVPPPADLEARMEAQNFSTQWWKAKEDGLVSRSFAVRLIGRLRTLELNARAERSAVVADLLTSDDVLTPERAARIRKAILMHMPCYDTNERMLEGRRLTSRMDRPTKLKIITAAFRKELANWFTTTPAYTRALHCKEVQEWVQHVNKRADISWAKVTAVQKTGIKEDGYDLTVPGYETFMSADGIILSNTMNVHVPSMDDSVKEAYDKLLPSKMLFSIRDQDKVVPVPKHEFVLGLYTANMRPSKNTHQFDTEEDALSAIRAGKLSLSDDITIGKPQPANAPQTQPNALPDKLLQ